ncbi:uncharacterized protein LOC123676543 [Harmonia axyridis]|uniref:uncharacterized protein LOC123676543 n=1 Tax=Harmonia axyridis TaxID=115357 RepID=UPI001E279586|nr:uncharacterized protein LOC123676543 [Harmonia axyridis]
MKLSHFFHIILILSCLGVSHSLFGKKKKFQILKFEECSDYPNLNMRVIEFKNHAYSKKNRTMEVTLQVDKDITEDMWVTTNLWKCDLSGAPDTCEFYVKDLKIDKLCAKIPQKNQAWTSMVESFRPEFSCPLKKGKYASEPVIDETPFRFFPLPMGLWKTKAFIYEGDDKIFCLDFHAKIYEVREN